MGNPFTPSFGQVPARMAGRFETIDAFRIALDEGPGNPDLCTILEGTRGMGKTALLLQLGREAEERGWIFASATTIPGMLEDLHEQAARKAGSVAGVDVAGAGGVGGAADVAGAAGVGGAADEADGIGGVDVAGADRTGAVGKSGADTSATRSTHNWRSRMTDLLEALDQTGTGIVLALDEIDPDLDEVVQLVTAYQHFVCEGRRVALLMAGFPSRIASLIGGKSTSFLYSANRVPLGRVPDAEIADAFRETARLGGKRISDTALARAVAAAGGFPLMMQMVGYRCWNAAGDEPKIGKRAAARGISLAESDLESRVLRTALDELSRRDLDVLAAMLPDAGPSTASDVAVRTGMTPGNVSTYRKRLLEQGVIENAGRQGFRFALPRLREYLPVYLGL